MKGLSIRLTPLTFALLPMPALALSWGCTMPIYVLTAAYKDASWIALPLSIVLYAGLTRRFPTLPVITVALYFVFGLVGRFVASGTGNLDSCPETAPNAQALEDPRVDLVGVYLALIAALTLWQLYKNRKGAVKGKTLALCLHLGLTLAPAVYALYVLSDYVYKLPQTSTYWPS